MSETPEQPDVEQAPETPRRGRNVGGCALRFALAGVALFAIFIVLGLLFGDDDESSSGGTRAFNAGTAENYLRGEVSHLEQQHVFVVRLEDGSFIALYDKSPKQQEIDSGCRVRWEDNANLGGVIGQLAGFNGAFAETCEGTRGVWRADGERAYGAGYGDLDRFPAQVDVNGDLLIDLSSRTCTRSAGGIGVPPFAEATCTGDPD
jgi:hypothetical protein